MNNKLREIVEEIERQREKLLQVVAELSQQQLDFQPSPDSWSVGEVLHHLFLIEMQVSNLAAQLLSRAFAQGIGPDPEGDSSALRSLDHLREVTAQNKFKAIPQTAPRSGTGKKELLGLLESSREALHKVITDAAKYDLNQLVFPHPYLGEFNLYQWFLFTGRHEQRHRGQIRGILENPAYPKAA
jgi:uncharacterized damage-inducible protein DinB